MAERKTRPTGQSVADVLNAVEPEQKRTDCWTVTQSVAYMRETYQTH